jgi:hypothetical protein
MATRYKVTSDATPGFAFKLTEDTQLSLAMLICEDEEGRYEPVACASTIGEARELADSHFSHAVNDTHTGLNPYVYKLWAQGLNGTYRLAVEIDPFYKGR